MGWVDSLRGKKVYFDSMPLIYYIEENPFYLKMVDPFFDAMDLGEFTAITSVVTLLEELVHPYRDGNKKMEQLYRDALLSSDDLEIIILDKEIAEEAAHLRAFHKLRTPDAIYMATAIHEKAAFFVTNDYQLPSFPGLQVLMLDDLKTEP